MARMSPTDREGQPFHPGEHRRRERRVTCHCAPRTETHVRDGRYVVTVIHSAACPVSEEQGTIFEDRDDGPVGDSG